MYPFYPGDEAPMTSDILIRKLNEPHEFAELLELQQAVWQMTPADCVSPLIMKAVTHTGGVVIGAEHGGRLVGFCFGFAARRGGRWLLWSLETGVLPDYQRRGLGTLEAGAAYVGTRE
jgi:predicted GNAT superfamily acetyltransferase